MQYFWKVKQYTFIQYSTIFPILKAFQINLDSIFQFLSLPCVVVNVTQPISRFLFKELYVCVRIVTQKAWKLGNLIGFRGDWLTRVSSLFLYLLLIYRRVFNFPARKKRDDVTLVSSISEYRVQFNDTY